MKYLKNIEKSKIHPRTNFKSRPTFYPFFPFFCLFCVKMDQKWTRSDFFGFVGILFDVLDNLAHEKEKFFLKNGRNPKISLLQDSNPK